MANLISDCCGKTTFRRSGTEYPLGGSTWGISYTEKAPACSGCGKDCEEIESCDQCGAPGILERIDGDDCCESCAAEMRKLNPEVAAI